LDKSKKIKVSEENGTFKATGVPVYLMCAEKTSKNDIIFRINTQPLLKNVWIDLLQVDNLGFYFIYTRNTQVDIE